MPLDMFAPVEGAEDVAPSFVRSGAYHKQLKMLRAMKPEELREFIKSQYEKHKYKVSEMSGGALINSCPVDGEQLSVRPAYFLSCELLEFTIFRRSPTASAAGAWPISSNSACRITRTEGRECPIS